jgi:hypothetical protein
MTTVKQINVYKKSNEKMTLNKLADITLESKLIQNYFKIGILNKLGQSTLLLPMQTDSRNVLPDMNINTSFQAIHAVLSTRN